MARNNILIDKASEQGVTVEQLITDAIAKHGSIFRAAVALGVAPNTIQYWLKRMGRTTETLTRLVPATQGDVEDAVNLAVNLVAQGIREGLNNA